MSSEGSKKNNAVQIDNPDLAEAINACLKHANEHYGLSVKDIAPGMNTKMFTLFKWIESGKMPLNVVAQFENLCHARYITRHLAEVSGFILVTCPRGMETPENALVTLNKTTVEAVGSVAGFMSGDKSKRDAIKAIDTAIESLVWQKSRIQDA
jgi:hypothetical protein